MKGAVRFYVLVEYRLHGCDAVTVDDQFVTDAPTCRACGGALGFCTLLPPIEVDFELCPRGYCDVVYLPHNDFLVSARFK